MSEIHEKYYTDDAFRVQSFQIFKPTNVNEEPGKFLLIEYFPNF